MLTWTKVEITGGMKRLVLSMRHVLLRLWMQKIRFLFSTHQGVRGHPRVCCIVRVVTWCTQQRRIITYSTIMKVIFIGVRLTSAG